MHANNVLAHVADVHGFLDGIRLLLKENGRAVIEVPYVRDLVEKLAFDTIYHEHLCYFSVRAVERLVRPHGLFLVRVERVPITAARSGSSWPSTTAPIPRSRHSSPRSGRSGSTGMPSTRASPTE